MKFGYQDFGAVASITITSTIFEFRKHNRVVDTALLLANVSPNLPGPDEVTVSVSYLDTLIAQLEAAEQALIKPLPIGELIHRLEGQTYRKWYDDDEPDKMRERAEAAEARLLVPVKFPTEFYFHSPAESIPIMRSTHVREAIKLAGFTVDGFVTAAVPSPDGMIVRPIKLVEGNADAE